MIDQARIEAAALSIIEAIGDDPRREGLQNTPQRIAEMYAELFSGLDMDAKTELTVGFEEGHREMVILRDIPFYSMCEHHLLPFFGQAHIAYIPKGDRVTGFSSLVRVVERLAHRPQIQEKFTGEIADVIMKVLKPMGVFVITEAEQLCLTMRNFGQPGVKTISSAIRGAFRKDATREEALFLIKSNKI